MNNLYIESTKTTPAVSFNFNSGNLTISGESYPENSADFYAPVYDWINKYISRKGSIKFMFKLAYFNTSSSKAILDIIQLLENYYNRGGSVEFEWFYEVDDEDIMESGIEFTDKLTMPCKIVAYKD